MIRMMRRLFLLALVLGILGLTPGVATAQPQTETLTILVDVTMGPHALVGTYIVERATDGSGHVDWSIRGMFDGRAGTAYGTVRETWNPDGSVTLELLTLQHRVIKIEMMPTRTINIGQQWTGLITVAGVPYAVQGRLRPVGQGSDPVLIITNAGQGPAPIASLPNTAGAPQPALPPAGLLAALAAGLFTAALLLGRSAFSASKR